MSNDIHTADDSSSTPLDPQEITGLIPPLATQEELNAAEAQNIADARYWIRNRKKRLSTSEVLTEKWAKLLHKKMYCDVWEWAGDFRRTEKNIGLDDWTRVPVELKQAIDTAREQHAHLLEWKLTHQHIAAQLSQKVVWVHPFPNGNGRWSRELANAYLLANKQPIFTWGINAYLDPEERRKAYVKALKHADTSTDVSQLLKFASD